MVKLNRPKGLIRYDSTRALETGQRKFWRPRLAVYLVAGIIGLSVGTVNAFSRQSFEANIVNMSGLPFVMTDEEIRNQKLIHLVNKSADPMVLILDASPSDGIEIQIPQTRVELPGLADRTVPVVLTAKRAGFVSGARVRIEVSVDGDAARKVLSVEFVGPRERLQGQP